MLSMAVKDRHGEANNPVQIMGYYLNMDNIIIVIPFGGISQPVYLFLCCFYFGYHFSQASGCLSLTTLFFLISGQQLSSGDGYGLKGFRSDWALASCLNFSLDKHQSQGLCHTVLVALCIRHPLSAS